jgi:GNAT superfamily N-acetyltransferase
MSLSLRSLNADRDIHALTAFLRQVQRNPPTQERVRAMLTATLPLHRLTAITRVDDTFVGYCSLTRLASDPAHQALLWIATHPDYRRRGIATALYADAYAVLPSYQITNLRARVEEQDAPSLAFVHHHGFTVARHLVRCTLDLHSFDATPFQGSIHTAQAHGITFTTLAMLGDTPIHRQRIYTLNKVTAADIPGRGPFYSFDEYEAQRFGHAGYRADGIIVALKQEEWVGFTQVSLNEHEQLAVQEMTGVLRTYRGQQIAQALKLSAIRYAQEQQMARMVTFNDAVNLPILAINRKLGYHEEPGFYILQAEVQHDRGAGAT